MSTYDYTTFYTKPLRVLELATYETLKEAKYVLDHFVAKEKKESAVLEIQEISSLEYIMNNVEKP